MVYTLTTNYAVWRCLTLAARYQLTQFVLKIGFALAKKGGLGGGGWVLAQGAERMAAALASHINGPGQDRLNHFSPC